MKRIGLLKGILIGIICSTVVPWLFMLLAQRGAGGYTLFFGETWPYYAIATPCVPIFAFLGYYLALKKSVTNK